MPPSLMALEMMHKCLGSDPFLFFFWFVNNVFFGNSSSSSITTQVNNYKYCCGIKVVCTQINEYKLKSIIIKKQIRFPVHLVYKCTY